ncbi:class A beta-lactamase-related serine hydrolase [Flavobacterium sufflavum]|uniref:Class A beta-lactamase-related serine hydrolase n=1 Tax=Flavobacterium sufflavum TaxID=1921138 RepID=A0A437KKG0_9FLAO|nr:serine hydrolase domain-containing protein [Flavobacterium sufflavum]RVT71090.1 class A beta-lactamase-related serine hydrolase [Flavobacterium sufflavum]
MNKIILFLFLSLILSFSSYGQNINTEKIDQFLDVLASQDFAMGSLSISQNGNLLYQKAIGYASIDNSKKTPATTATKYRIGSATKMFTAVLIFQLVEEGKIKLEQKLSDFYPQLPNANKITISDMLYHRSGLHDYTKETNYPDWMNKTKTHDELLEIIKEKGSDFEPNTKADYSNSNYLLLGYIIENKCKMPYAKAIEKRITSKLKLKDTYYGSSSNIRNDESGSFKYSDNKWNTVKKTNLGIHGGAGALISTPTDMTVFINALFTNKLVNKSSLSKMKDLIDDYGMGLFSNKYGTETSFGHNGRVEEFYTAVWYFPTQKLSFAYCTNGILYPRTDLIDGILKICFNQEFTIPFSKNYNLKSEDLDQYLGQYSSGQIVVNCTKNNTKLLIESKGKTFEAIAIADNYFMNKDLGYFFEFNPEKRSLLIKETDNVYFLKKVN